jgi:hypothetical protein
MNQRSGSLICVSAAGVVERNLFRFCPLQSVAGSAKSNGIDSVLRVKMNGMNSVLREAGHV